MHAPVSEQDVRRGAVGPVNDSLFIYEPCHITPHEIRITSHLVDFERRLGLPERRLSIPGAREPVRRAVRSEAGHSLRVLLQHRLQPETMQTVQVA